jgi:hypothetical protein
VWISKASVGFLYPFGGFLFKKTGFSRAFKILNLIELNIANGGSKIL